MSKQDAYLERTVSRLEDIDKKLDVIVSIMKKPDGKFGKALETVGTVVGVFGILSIIDIVIHWLGL